MDTTWFAVDRDGHVAVFESSENGPVPKASEPFSQLDSEMLDALAALPETGTPRLDPAGRIHPAARPEAVPALAGTAKPREPGPALHSAIVFPATVPIPATLLAAEGIVVQRARSELPALALGGEELFVVIVDGARASAETKAVWQALHAEAASAGAFCLFTRWLSRNNEPMLARRGVFAYTSHDHRFLIAEPYGRSFVPERPLHVDALPPEVRAIVDARPRLDVSFAEDPYVQPAELVPVGTWGVELYLGRDGCTLRPLPGTEAMFEENVGGLDFESGEENFLPVRFEPPIDEP